MGVPPANRITVTAPAEPLPPDSGIATGRLTPQVIGGLGPPRDASAYVCGPEPFMDDVTAALFTAGLDATRIHTERFGFAPAED